MKRRREKRGEKKILRYILYFSKIIQRVTVKRIIKTFRCFLAQMQEAAKVETKPEKTEKKKTKYVNLLSHGDVLLKGIYNNFSV